MAHAMMDPTVTNMMVRRRIAEMIGETADVSLRNCTCLMVVHSLSGHQIAFIRTLNVILKFQEDVETVQAELQGVTNRAIKAS